MLTALWKSNDRLADDALFGDGVDNSPMGWNIGNSHADFDSLLGDIIIDGDESHGFGLLQSDATTPNLVGMF